MKETIARTLSGLESVDNGFLEIRLWHSVYPPESIRAAAEACREVCAFEVIDHQTGFTLLRARALRESRDHRRAVGELLNELLRNSVERAFSAALPVGS